MSVHKKKNPGVVVLLRTSYSCQLAFLRKKKSCPEYASALVSPENLLVLGILNNKLLATVELGDQRLALDDLELLFGVADQSLDFGRVGLVFGGVECISGAADGIVAEVVGGEFG